MADSLYIDATQFKKGSADFKTLIASLPGKISDVLNKNILEIDANAKRRAPADRGQIRQGISPDISKPLEKRLTSRAPYSAYIEFGTGKAAAQYVATLPADYQTFAAQFKGSAGGGNFKEFVRLIYAWMKRKGITSASQKDFNPKTGRRLGNRTENRLADLGLAYIIARSIYIKGVHPHPFMIPALIEQQPVLIRDMENLLKTLKVG